jgi:Ribbon-helix-helix protein, copG family
VFYITVVAKADKKPPKARAWRPTIEDEKLLDELKNKMGVVNEADLIRQALRKLAEFQGLR